MFIDDFSKTDELIYSAKDTLVSLNKNNELKMVFRERDLEAYRTYAKKTWQDCLSIALSNSMMFATKAILLTKEEEHWYNNKSIPASLYTRRELVDVLKDEEFNKTTMEHVEKEIIIIPEKITKYFEEWIDDYEWEAAEPNIIYDFNSEPIDNLTLPIALHSQNSLSEIVSLQTNVLSNDVRLDMCLPTIKNIPLSDLIAIKNDHQEAFSRYQNALKRLCNHKLNSYSDENIRLIFEEIQDEVRNIESEMICIKRSNYGTIVGASLGITTVGVCLFMPSDIATLIGLIAGGSSLKDLVLDVIKLRKLGIAKKNVKKSDFYFPWLITDKP